MWRGSRLKTQAIEWMRFGGWPVVEHLERTDLIDSLKGLEGRLLFRFRTADVA